MSKNITNKFTFPKPLIFHNNEWKLSWDFINVLIELYRDQKITVSEFINELGYQHNKMELKNKILMINKPK